MNKKIIIFCLILGTFFCAFSQNFNYQATVRDNTGDLAINQPISVQVKLLQGSANGVLVYTETHAEATNAYGVLSLVVGNGTTTDVFSSIDWSTQNYWLEVATDLTGGTSYTVIGSSQLLSVPHANYALNSPDADPTNEIELPIGGTDGQVLTTDGSGAYSWTNQTLADNLGNHIVTTNMQLGDNWISPDGTNKGLTIRGNTTNTSTYVEVNNTTGTRALFGPDGTGYSGGDTNDVAISNWSNGDLTFFTNATERMRIDSIGNVGIGKTVPNAKLNVNGAIRVDTGGIRVDSGGVRIDAGGNALSSYGTNGSLNFLVKEEYANAGSIHTYNTSGAERFATIIDTNTDVGAVFVSGPNSTNFLVGNLDGSVDNGFVAVADATSSPVAGMYVDANGQGVVYGNIKNFRMDHPSDKAKEIWYASLEGPEAGAYARGTATLTNGTAFIQFPDHYKEMVNEATITLSLTPNDANSKGLSVVAKNSQQFQVKELMEGDGNYSFDWVAFGVRKGFEDFEVVRNKQELPAMKQGDKLRSSIVPAGETTTKLKTHTANTLISTSETINLKEKTEIEQLRKEVVELKKLINSLLDK